MNDRVPHPFDPGLQPERTALAWRRSALAIMIGSLVALRVGPALVGVWFLVPSVLVAALSAALLVLAHRRYLAHRRDLTGTDAERIPLADGLLPALLAGLALAVGVAGLIVVLAL